MKRQHSLSNVILILLLLLPACQNNGYIGPLFGQWQVTQIESNTGTENPRDLFFSFQSCIINFKRTHLAGRLGEFTHQADSIQFRLYKGSMDEMHHYGLTDTIDCFTVHELDWQNLVIQSRKSGTLFRLRKF